MENNNIQIKIIRHADRLDQSNPAYWLMCFGQYWMDSPLSMVGYTNAKTKAMKIESGGFVPKYIYASPYNRTLATATEMRSIFSNAEVIIEPLLAEYQPYYYHRITLYPTGIPTLYNGAETEFSYPESLPACSNRSQFIIHKLIEKTSENILIVTHGEILKSYIGYLQKSFPSLLLDPGKTPTLTVLSFEVNKNTKECIQNSIKIDTD